MDIPPFNENMITSSLKEIEKQNRLYWSNLLELDYLIKDINNIVYDYLREYITIRNVRKIENIVDFNGIFTSEGRYKTLIFTTKCSNFNLGFSFGTRVWIRNGKIAAIDNYNNSIVIDEIVANGMEINEEPLFIRVHAQGSKKEIYINTKFIYSFETNNKLVFTINVIVKELIIY